MRPQLYKVYKFNSSHQRHHLYQTAQYHLIVKDLSLDVYRLSFGLDCGSRFGGMKLLTLLHLDESTGLLRATIDTEKVTKNTDR